MNSTCLKKTPASKSQDTYRDGAINLIHDSPKVLVLLQSEVPRGRMQDTATMTTQPPEGPLISGSVDICMDGDLLILTAL